MDRIPPRYDVLGVGHDTYRDLMTALGGLCRPEIVGWCELELEGVTRGALVVRQTWPLGLPFGTDPAPILKARRYVAVMATDHGFRIIPVDPPPADLEQPRRP